MQIFHIWFTKSKSFELFYILICKNITISKHLLCLDVPRPYIPMFRYFIIYNYFWFKNPNFSYCPDIPHLYVPTFRYLYKYFIFDSQTFRFTILYSNLQGYYNIQIFSSIRSKIQIFRYMNILYPIHKIQSFRFTILHFNAKILQYPNILIHTF